jgi:hypothetical protein
VGRQQVAVIQAIGVFQQATAEVPTVEYGLLPQLPTRRTAYASEYFRRPML